VTRDNNARIRTETDRQVVNRAVWQVTSRHPNGAVTVVSERWADRLFLPPSYVVEHVELAYATTIAGVQGLTVDGGRALYNERTSRSELYVAMTRGRHFNIGYGVLDAVSDTDQRQAAHSAAGLFARVIGNDSRESSAMEVFAEELALSDSTVRLDAIRDDWTMSSPSTFAVTNASPRATSCAPTTETPSAPSAACTRTSRSCTSSHRLAHRRTWSSRSSSSR
jgi:hypothetical protein